MRAFPPGAALVRKVSPGVAAIILVFLVSAPVVLLRPDRPITGPEFWTFSTNHARSYAPFLAAWNARPDHAPVSLSVLDLPALERRMLSGFQAGTPVADLIEVERAVIGRVFAGPLDAVGFVDLTERLDREGLREQINPPSLSAWTTRGRVFGLPHDVHPVLLAYRADIVEAAGIDLSKVETWEDFFAALRPLMADQNGDGRPDRYLLNLWPTQADCLEALLLQAGGGLFDADEQVAFLQEPNVTVVATLATWMAGPGRVALDAPRFSAAGNRLVLDGTVIATLMPDWLAGAWQQDLPGLAGRVRLMPLPAWRPGGRRTSVLGGTMLGVTRASARFEESWAFARELYFSPALAEDLFRKNHIISPIIARWSLPCYREPNPFFNGQPSGELYVRAAPDVPPRNSSPFNPMALEALTGVVLRLCREADARGISDPRALEPLARELLAAAETDIRRRIARNVFLRPAANAP